MNARFLIDSVILIDHFNGINKATEWLASLVEGEAVISSITRAEVLSGADEEDFHLVLDMLNSYECLPVSEKTADLAAELRRQNRWKLPDAFQAALSIQARLKLVTRNRKDFDPEKHHFVFIPYKIHNS